MDKLKQKLRKEKSTKECKKDKYPQFITDVNSIKENLKIKEILRTVKMSNSVRLKAPHGNNVMSNKDFNKDDCLEISADQNSSEPLSAMNPDVLITKTISTDSVESIRDICENESAEEFENRSECNIILDEVKKPINNIENNEKNNSNQNELNLVVPNGKSSENSRERKLSLDHTILSRQDGFSQSELDLHSIGKSPLERKSSFFRKKMDSFVRNTTEMFRRQNRSLQRRVSMSVSLQSLNEKYQSPSPETITNDQQESYGSRSSLQTPTPIVRSTSSLSLRHSAQPPSPSPQNSLAGSHPTLHALPSSTLENLHSNSDLNLNDFYLKEAMLKSRAISMNSGLDSPFGQQRKKTSRSNRVTWIASEGLTNYLRRKIQDETSKEMHTSHSYQDFSCIPEHELYCQNPDTKGRRLSYQRAVSGEDPVMPVRYQDSTLRRRHPIAENVEAHSELATYLTEFTQKGVPTLQCFELAHVPDEAIAYLLWATKLKNIEEIFDWQTLPAEEQSRQAVIRELIHTEAEYIKHLMAIVEVFIGAAHAIQDRGKMLNIQTSKLFSNLPDLLNSSLHFWNLTFMPMIKDAVNCERPFDTDLMVYGFACFKEILWAYEKFVVDQSKLLEYYRKCQSDAEFNVYLAWCHSQKACNRLQLNDFLVKPMQRLTKYGLILHRIANHTESEYERSSVEAMETYAKNYVVELNRCVRQREEIEKVIDLENMLIAYDMVLKDEEVEKVFKAYAHLNLLAPMLYCLPTHSRSLIHQADLRFRDGAKEIEVRVFLLTDMLLVSRRLTKGNQFKLIRPKYMIDKLVQITKYDKHNRDLTGLAYVMVDDVGSSYASFILSETPKDPNPQLTLKTWENKVKEAKLTYELTVWVARNPNRDVTRQDVDLTAEHTSTRPRHATEEETIEHEARERVATMVQRSMGASFDRNISPISLITDSFDGSLSLSNQIVVGVSARPPIPGKKHNIVHRTSTVFSSGSTPRNSRLSSFQQSTSAHSHDEPQAGPSRLLHRASTSVEHHLPPVPDANEGSPSITVSDSETVSAQAPTLKPVPIKSADSRERSSSAHSTLRVQPQNNVATLIYSLPDLTVEPSTPRTISSPTQPTASERMYQSHQEILQRNRLMACQNQQYLSPDHRGSSYPPPSPTRASLKRGFAFSYSTKNPPLTKMGHVTSQSQMQLDAIPTSSGKDEKTSPKAKSSTDKSDKKSKLTSTSRRKRTGEEVKSDTSSSRKDESPSRREVINDPFKSQGSSCSSYKDESPGTSFRDESPGASFRDESTSPSHKDESLEVSYKEGSPDQSISKSPSPRHKDDKSKPVMTTSGEKYSVPDQRPDSSGLEKSDTLDSNLRDEDDDLAGRRESKSSDSIQKEKSHSFSFKDGSCDSSHREESFSLSHKDETPSSDRKEIPSPTTRSESVEPYTKEASVKKLDDGLDGNVPMQSPEIREDSNIKDSPDLSHKTEASSVICKEDSYKGTINTINKYICLECGQAYDEYREQDEESVWNVWLCSEHANSSHKQEEAGLGPGHRCRFSSSSTSSIQTHEDLSSSTSKATDVDSSIKYEVFSSSSSSVHAQEEHDERCQTVPSPSSTQTAPEPGPSYEGREESTSSSSKEEKLF